MCLTLPRRFVEEFLGGCDICYYWLVYSGPRKDDRKGGVIYLLVSPQKDMLKS